MSKHVERVIITGATSGIGFGLASAGFVSGTTLEVDGGYSHGR